jgi:hypothetical protein
MHDPRPQRNTVGFHPFGNVDRPAEEVDPASATGWVGRYERRLMLGSRIEKKPRASLDYAAKISRLEREHNLLELRGRSAVVRIERSMIERDGDASVSNVGQQTNCVEQIMMSEAVRVISEKHQSIWRC